MTATRFAGFWSTRNNHGLKQPASYSCDLCYYSSSPRTRRTVTVSRNTWFQRCSQGSGIRCQSRQGGGTMLQDGSSWRQPMRRRPALPDCTARPTGRTAQPPAACAKPFNCPCGQGALLVAQATKPLNSPYGQGALLVAQATATHMPCELWLHYCIEKYAPRTYVGFGLWRRGERRTPLRVCAKRASASAVFSQVVFMTERETTR